MFEVSDVRVDFADLKEGLEERVEVSFAGGWGERVRDVLVRGMVYWGLEKLGERRLT